MSIENSNEHASLINLQKEIDTINGKLNKIMLNNRSQKKRICELEENDDLHDLIYNMEIQMNNLNQYTRSENVEIKNISESIVQRHLELYVLKVFQLIGVKLESYNFVAVHRVGKYVHGKIEMSLFDS